VSVTPIQLNDEQLWEKFRQGDQSAFAMIYQLHYRTLYGYGKKFGLHESIVEDAIQDLFVNLWQTKSNLSLVNNIKYYLFRCLRRDLHRVHIKEGRMESIDEQELKDSLPLLFEDFVFQPEETESELAAKLVTILKKLPKRQLEAITLRYYENFSSKEIAAIMEVSEKTVRNTLYNALVFLRESVISLIAFLQFCLFHLSGKL
jgi:RNA polymerase sigma-70 factor (ECF subfamily)